MPTTDELQQQIDALTQRVDSITAPPTDYYVHRYSGEEIDNAVQGGLLLGTPSSRQQALRNIGGRPNRNLLDNAYFVGGGSQQDGGKFPINQRGQTSWSAAGPMFDRWKLVSGTASLTAAGVTLNGTMVQVLENDPPGETTATALTTTGIVDCTYDSGTKTFTITGTGETFLAAKLELGSTQSLAREDDSGNWHVLEIPKYGEELAKCQRYLLLGPLDAIHFTINGLILLTPVQMRITPTVLGNVLLNKVSDNTSISGVPITPLYVGASGVVFSYIYAEPLHAYFPEGSGVSAEL